MELSGYTGDILILALVLVQALIGGSLFVWGYRGVLFYRRAQILSDELDELRKELETIRIILSKESRQACIRSNYSQN